jgi:hypothetical protein
VRQIDVASPKVALKASANPAPHPETVVYSVTVSGVAGITPTGTVSISDGQGGTCNTDALDSSGKASCEITEGTGTYTVTASYSGDSNYKSATKSLSEKVKA